MADFTIIVGQIYKMGNDEILRRYVLEFERGQILVEARGGVAGGHYVGREITQKILRERLWWLTMHKDSNNSCRACDVCQRMGRLS